MFFLRVHNLEGLSIVFNSAYPLAKAGSGVGFVFDVFEVKVFLLCVLFNFLKNIAANIFLVEVEKVFHELGIV